MSALAISPLSMNQLTRDLWSQYDASAIWQLAPLCNDPCYSLKFYKAPADQDELVATNGFVPYGLRITPGSIIFGYYLPCIPDVTSPWASAPGAWTVQITDVSMKHKWFDDPVSSLFLANFKPTFQSNNFAGMGSFPNLLAAPYPVVGSGLFDIEIQETSGSQQRIQLVFGVLEVCSNATC